MTCTQRSYFQVHAPNHIATNTYNFTCKHCRWLMHQDMWTQVGREAAEDVYTMATNRRYCKVTGEYY